MKTLLEVLPAIAAKTQFRFSVNFQYVLTYMAENNEITGTMYFVHYRGVSADGGIRCCFTKNLSEVLDLVRKYGKDCQVFQITEEGTVNEL